MQRAFLDRFRADDHHAAALLSLLAPGHGRIAERRDVALKRTGDADFTRAVLEFGLSRADASPQDRAVDHLMRITSEQVLDDATIESAFPDVRTLDDLLDALPDDPVYLGRARGNARRVADLRGLDGPARGAFMRRVTWGMVAALVARGIGRARGQGERLRALAREIDARVDGPAPEELERMTRTDRSVVILRAHAGPASVLRPIVNALDRPTISFAGAAHHDDAPGRTYVAVRGGAQAAFAKAVKALRRERAVATIFPDGGAGADRIAGRVLGQDVTIGAGGPVLAALGRADTWFLEAAWTPDRRIRRILTPGPRWQDGADPDAHRDAVAAFYVAQLDRIARGAPENIVAQGGIWAQLG